MQPAPQDPMRSLAQTDSPIIPSTSPLVCRNVVVGGKRTSMRLEPTYWEALNTICTQEEMSVNDLCTRIGKQSSQIGLTTAVRVAVLEYFWRPDARPDLFATA